MVDYPECTPGRLMDGKVKMGRIVDGLIITSVEPAGYYFSRITESKSSSSAAFEQDMAGN